jgi:hypothetical protein
MYHLPSVDRPRRSAMSVAYLILAHDNPRHLSRLLSSLASSTSAFFVHIDKKSRCEFTHELSEDTVRFSTDRYEVHWGDFSMVEATLSLMDQALHDPRRFDRLVLLSGVDYPVRAASYVESVFELHREAEFISIVRMPSEAADKPLNRLTRFRPSPDESRIRWFIRGTLRRARFIPRERDFKKALGALAPYAGWQWWALTRDACEHVQSFCASNPKIVSFFRNTHIPDEMFFQTIIGNSPYKDMVLRNLTFTDWTAGGRSPAQLSSEHVERFASVTSFGPHDVYGDGEILFARKFSDENQGVVDSLHRLIQQRDA